MKILKLKYIPVAAALLLSTSCKKDFIDLDPKGVFLSENYYATKDQAFSAMVGVYDVFRKNSGGFENMITMMNAGSDDQYAGGGGPSDGAGIHGLSNFTINANTVPGSYWNDFYQGIFKANTFLLKVPNTVMDEDLKARYMAEVKALRAYSYFQLEILFKNIPLILEPLTTGNMYDVVQATSEQVYAQIEKDLTEAIPLLPPTVPLATEAGRLNKGAAQALLGKVYLYEKKMDQAAAQLAEVNGTPGQANQYGNKLLPKFSELWVIENKFNSESIIEACHSGSGASDWGWWGASNDEGNTVCQMVGPRSYSRPAGSTAPDLYSGWSFNVFTQDFYDFIKNDPRFSETIMDVKALKAAGQADYLEGDQNTGYFLNKFLPLNSEKPTGAGSKELNFRQDTYIIRLADTYLMEAEALGATGARAQALLDAVRARVGLPSVPVSMAAIKNERRAELAGEGFRFLDLVRWGDAPIVLASRGFTANKNEVLPIPEAELQGTKLVQNPGYNQ